MDPNLFHIDYERLMEVLVTIVILSMIIERALSVLFESKWFIDLSERKQLTVAKEVISFIVSAGVCIVWQFDAISVLVVSTDHMTLPGMVITGAVIAGGSKGSVKLFRDVLGFMSSAEKEKDAVRKARVAEARRTGVIQETPAPKNPEDL